MVGVLPKEAVILWGVLVAALFAYSLSPGRSKKEQPFSFAENKPWSFNEKVLVFSLLLLGFFLRTYRLFEYPIEIHNDEASVGIFASRWVGAKTFPYVFGAAWAGLPEISYIVSGLSMMILGESLWALRMGSAVFGTLSLLGAYLLFRLLFGRGTALIALSLLVPFHWHIHISRTGHHYIQAAFVFPWGLYLYLKGIAEKRTKLVILASLFTGFSVHMYFAARVLPVIQGAIALFLLAKEPREWRWLLKSYAVFAFVFFLFLLPSIYYFANNQWEFEVRTKAVSIFNEAAATHIHGYVGSSSPLDIARYQLVNAFGIFFFRGDSSLQYGRLSPFLNPALHLPFVAGFILAIRNFWSVRWFTILSAFLLTVLLGGALTIDPPFSPRLSTLPPLILIFPAAFLAFILAKFPAKLTELAVSLAIVAVGISDLYWYKTKYLDARLGQRRDQIVRIIDENPSIATVVNLFPEKEVWHYESYQFLAPNREFLEAYGYPIGSLKNVISKAKSALIVSPDPIGNLGPSEVSGFTQHPQRFYFAIISPVR